MSSRTLFQYEIHPGARRGPWTLLSAIALQLLIAAALLVYPMLWPETLPFVQAAPKVATVLLRAEPPKPTPRPRSALPSAARAFVPTNAPVTRAASVRRIFSTPAASADAQEPALFTGPLLIGSTAAGPGGPLLSEPAGPTQSVSARAVSAPRAAVRLSSGVTSGLLLAPIQPVYPSIAKVARVEGTVVVTATIDREGRVVGARVVSGPELLRSAALEAVASARYRPYRLNGEATEVLTTVSVNFRISG